MSSTFGGLNILSRSLYAQQASLDTVGHNIANAGTEGYSRQRVNLVTASPAGEVYGRNKNYAGSGVTVASITRARDIFTDRQLWKESATLGYSDTSSAALSRMEGVFTEPSDTGIQTVLNQFWSAWQTLATDASDSGARTAVAQRGVAVVKAVEHAATQLRDTADNINSEVVAAVSKINQLTESISKLNEQIAFTEFSGTNNANDLRDSRDLLVDQLSKLADISVKEDSLGKYTIQSTDVTLVNGNGYTKLGTVTEQNDTSTDVPGYAKTTVVVAETQKPVEFTNGEVKALIDSRDSEIMGINKFMTSLEAVSKFLLVDFNAVHRSGYGTDNAKDRNFFGDGYDSDLVTPGTQLETDYSLLTAAPPGGWINALKVNTAITGSTDGLAYIAAKSTAQVSSPTSGAGNTGSATISVNGTYTGGSKTTSVAVSVSSSGVVSYSADYGDVITTGIVSETLPAGSGSYEMTIQGLTIKLDTTASTTVGDTYNFTLSAGNNNASGDNALKLGNRLKTDASDNLGKISLDAYYSAMIGTLGVQAQDAERQNTNQQTVIDHLTNLRASTAGVNMDEEMTDMIRFQKGYNAAARVLTAMDEMLDKLINGTGVVGR